jgi:pilus assembly protein CpaE
MRTLIVHHGHQDSVLGRLTSTLQSLDDFAEPTLTSADEVEEQCPQTDAELMIVLLPHVDPEQGLEVIARLREINSGNLLAVGHVTDPKLILRSLQIGADLFVDQAELETALEAAISRLRIKQGVKAPTGRLLALLSVSGGCGSSTLAVNIAAVLAKEHGKSSLIDLNSSMGDLGVLLDLKPQHTLADVCRNETRVDRAMLEKMLLRHAAGIHLLAAPPQFEDVRVLTARGIGKALSIARRLFPVVVVDLEDCFHDDQVVVLQQATGILLVCRLDFTSLRNTRRILDHLHGLDVPRKRIKVVINQFGRPNELPVDEAEGALGERLNSFVPYDPRVINAANNSGVPAVLKDPSHKLAQSIIQLAKIDFEERNGASGFFPRIRQLLANH